MSELESLERRLNDHVQQDHDNFLAIRDSLENIGNKLDVISERTVKLETIHEVMEERAAKSGAMAGSKWAAVIGLFIGGVVNACSWITYGGN